MKSTHLHVARRGFTLVELLAVIVIIGILASMALYAASVAWVAAKNGRIAMDIKTLETDLQSYYSKLQSYPPDLVFVNGLAPATRQQAIRSHLTKMAPRYTGGMPLLPDTPIKGSQAMNSNVAAEALVFFLGGYSKPEDLQGSTKLLGFRADPANPFVSNVGDLRTKTPQGGWKKGSVGFDETRLVDLDNDGWYEYLPPYCTVPYAYFNSKTYMNPLLAARLPRCDWPGELGGTAVPYLSDNTSEKYMNPKTFQIIAAGQDNSFGVANTGDPTTATGKKFPSGLNYSSDDNDNLTNFAERTLKDSMP